MIEYDKYEKSLRHLVLQYNNYESLDDNQPVLIQEAVAESVIQRFETCYDCLWKVLKRYLIQELGLPNVPNSPKPIFRLANENNLFSSDIEQWLIYAESRISTSHDYSGEKTQQALETTGSFINDAIALFKKMSGQSWSS